MNLQSEAGTKISSRLYLPLILAMAVLLIVGAIDSIWSGSVDLAHHYALVARISEYWTMPAGADPSLGEMNYYPRSSHIMAAVAGKFFGSPLIGIQLITLTSIILLWASLSHMVLSLPKKMEMITVVTLAILLSLNRIWVHVDIHGHEVVGNFFYSQLVAQAIIAFSLAVAMSMDRNAISAPVRYSALLVFIYFTAGIHLLPALQLLCFFLALIGLEFLTQLDREKKRNIPSMLLGCAFMLLGIMLLARHPSFAAMKEISKNNGSLPLKYIGTIKAISAYSLFIAALSGCIVFQWFKLNQIRQTRQWILLKYVGLYGLAVSGLCLLQVFALKMGQGSEYAVKKHAFALNTVLLLELALLPLLIYLKKRQYKLPIYPAKVPGTFFLLLIPALTAFSFLVITPREKVYDTSDLVKLEKDLQEHRETLLSYAPDKIVYVLPSDKIPSTVAYMMTIGVFKSSHNPFNNLMSILKNEPMADWSLAGSVLAPATWNQSQFASCRRVFPALSTAVFDGKCIGDKMGLARSVTKFSTGSEVSPCILTGFSSAEPAGRWTDHTEASIECPTPEIDGRAATSVTISSTAFLDRVPFQRAFFSLNGSAPREFRYDAGQPQKSVELALTQNPGKTSRITISLPDAISPKQAGASEDGRRLGISVSQIEFK